ncbi:hypothetical protein NCPPB3923_17180 [Burkholderia glumae]|nr:hypothetical protein NCPPB3923_17180 [Burkholderia glumae]
MLTPPTQYRQMQPMPYTGGLPVSQTSPAPHAAAETLLLREVFPRDAGLQHIQDAVERSSDQSSTACVAYPRQLSAYAEHDMPTYG